MLKNPRSMKRYTCRHNSRTFLTKYLPTLLLDVSAATRAENLVDDPGMTRTHMGSRVDQ
jgi:hypothetical protein